MHTQTRSSQDGRPHRLTCLHREPTPEEIAVLRLLDEQVAIPLDQLARFCASGEAATLALVRELEAAACVEVGRFLVDQPPWVWLRSRGARLVGAPFGARTPAALLLAHRRAVNEVRLRLAERAPQGRWLCERTVYRRRDLDDHIPDAVFEIGGERHAIEVELSNKGERRTRLNVAEHSARYDAVIYFCGPQTRGVLERVGASGQFPKLLVRALPSSPEPPRLIRPPRGRAPRFFASPAQGALARPQCLPTGRHKLPREFVAENQRARLFNAYLPLVTERGESLVSLADVCTRARVSRRTLYQLFGDSQGFRHAAGAEAAGRGIELVGRGQAAAPPAWQALALRLLAEQGAIPADQLIRFLSGAPDAPADPAQSLCEDRFVHRRRFFAGEPEWIWLTWSTASQTEPAFGGYDPRPGGLARLRVLNEIRLKLDSPGAGLRWIGWRQVRRELRGAGSGNLPASLVEIGSERHAIELEMRNLKTEPYLAQMVEHRHARYDAVICFCARRPRRKLERLQAQNFWPKLLVRALPGGDPRPRQYKAVGA
jgi:hypothetical protein